MPPHHSSHRRCRSRSPIQPIKEECEIRKSDSSYQVEGEKQLPVIEKGESERVDESFSGNDHDQVTISVSRIPISEHLPHSHNLGSEDL